MYIYTHISLYQTHFHEIVKHLSTSCKNKIHYFVVHVFVVNVNIHKYLNKFMNFNIVNKFEQYWNNKFCQQLCK